MILIPQGSGLINYREDEILYVVADGSYAKIFVEDGKFITVTKNLNAVCKSLSQDVFFRIHRSHVININKVKEIRGKANLVVMYNGEELKVSGDKVKTLLSFYTVI